MMNIFNNFFNADKFKEIIPFIFKDYVDNHYTQYFNNIIRELNNNLESKNTFINFIRQLVKKKKFKTVWTLNEFFSSSEYLIEYWNNI